MAARSSVELCKCRTILAALLNTISQCEYHNMQIRHRIITNELPGQSPEWNRLQFHLVWVMQRQRREKEIIRLREIEGGGTSLFWNLIEVHLIEGKTKRDED